MIYIRARLLFILSYFNSSIIKVVVTAFFLFIASIAGLARSTKRSIVLNKKKYKHAISYHQELVRRDPKSVYLKDVKEGIEEHVKYPDR